MQNTGIVVVGNGNYTAPLGHIINTFDKVIRLSGFKILGYEHIVGTKTDIVAVARVENMEVEPNLVWIANKSGLSGVPIELVKQHYKNFVIADMFHWVESYQLLGYKTEDGVFSHPTLGFSVIIQAMMYSKYIYGQPVYICGFDFCQTGLKSYYFDATPREEYPDKRVHDFAQERKTVKELMVLGMVKLVNPYDLKLLDEGIIPDCVPQL